MGGWSPCACWLRRQRSPPRRSGGGREGDFSFGFTGEQTDANGLIYLRARHYAPSVGIFPSLDPFEGIVDISGTLNGYNYVSGNPLNWTDPSGLSECAGGMMGLYPCGGEGGSGGHYAIIGRILTNILKGAILGGAGVTTLRAISSTQPSEQGGAPSPQGPDYVNLLETATELVPDIDTEELARICNEGWCGVSGLIWLLARLGINIQTNTRVGEAERTREEDDCLQGQSPPIAALGHAEAAQRYWQQGTLAAGYNAPVVTAVTVVREGSDCKEYVAVSNALGNPTLTRVERYRSAWFGITASARGRLATPIGFPQPNVKSGIEGHAERLLYENLGTRIIAMGISKHPCTDDVGESISCSTWFRLSPQNTISVAFWNGQAPQTFQ